MKACQLQEDVRAFGLRGVGEGWGCALFVLGGGFRWRAFVNYPSDLSVRGALVEYVCARVRARLRYRWA